jgi:hypothetical protein
MLESKLIPKYILKVLLNKQKENHYQGRVMVRSFVEMQIQNADVSIITLYLG